MKLFNHVLGDPVTLTPYENFSYPPDMRPQVVNTLYQPTYIVGVHPTYAVETKNASQSETEGFHAAH